MYLGGGTTQTHSQGFKKSIRPSPENSPENPSPFNLSMSVHLHCATALPTSPATPTSQSLTNVFVRYSEAASQLPNWESFVFCFPTHHQPSVCFTLLKWYDQFLHSQYPPVSSNVACWKLIRFRGSTNWEMWKDHQSAANPSIFQCSHEKSHEKSQSYINQIRSNPIKSKSSRTFPWKIPIPRNPHQITIKVTIF